MKRTELLWMLLPCLLFVGVALWMRAREARWPTDGKFHLIIEKIETRPITAKDATNGYDTEVVTILNYRGPKPDWWGKQGGGWGDSSHAMRLIYENKGKARPVKMPPDFKSTPQIFYWRPFWKTDANRYEARFFLQLSKLPPRPEKTVLRGKMLIEDGNTFPHKPLSDTVPFAFTVREAKQVIKAPNISRDPLLHIIKTEINKPTATQQKTNGGYDTEVQVFLQDLGPPDSGGSTHGGDSIVDEKGNRINGMPGWSTSSGVRSSNPQRPILKFDCTLRAYPRSQRNIFVKMKYSQGDRWPLIVKVPLRVNGKDLKGSVQAKPETIVP